MRFSRFCRHGGQRFVVRAKAVAASFYVLHLNSMLAKGRRVSGRGEAMARSTTRKGEPPLKKLHRKFTSLVSGLDKDEYVFFHFENLAKAFLQELSTFEIPLLRSKAIVEANIREKDNLTELKDQMCTQISQAQADIEDLKKQLEESKIERSRKEDCEAIRKLIALHPTRSETHKLMTDLENEITSLVADSTASYALLELRKKQVSLLLHVVDELQNTIEEEQKSLIEGVRIAMEEHMNGMEDAREGSEALAVD